MGASDAAQGFLKSDMLFGGMWDGLIKTDKEKDADEARAKAAQQAQDQLDFDKAVYAENKGTIGDLGNDLFGPDEAKLTALAQQHANDERAQAARLQGSTAVKTPSGRKGTFDFGNPGTTPNAPASKAAAASGNVPPIQVSIDPDTGLAGYTDPKTGKVVMGYPPKGTPYSTPQTGVQSNGFGGAETVPVGGSAYNANTDTAQATSADASISDRDREYAQRVAQANYKNTLPGQLDASRARRGTAVDSFVNDLNGIKSVDAGNYDNAWNVDDQKQYISPEARAAQKQAMDKTFALTDTKETAEEKLMREMSRRNQERDLRAQSEAQANQLRSRGAYGSGAELAGFLGSQQELAQRRSLEELGADANAQQRAMAALGQYSNQSMQLGQQDLKQGAQRDLNSRFNSNSQQQFNQFKTKTQQAENEATAKRSASKADARLGLEDTARGDINSVADTKIRLAGAKTGTNLAGAAAMAPARAGLADAFTKKDLKLDADIADDKVGLF